MTLLIANQIQFFLANEGCPGSSDLNAYEHMRAIMKEGNETLLKRKLDDLKLKAALTWVLGWFRLEHGKKFIIFLYWYHKRLGVIIMRVIDILNIEQNAWDLVFQFRNDFSSIWFYIVKSYVVFAGQEEAKVLKHPLVCCVFSTVSPFSTSFYWFCKNYQLPWKTWNDSLWLIIGSGLYFGALFM